MKRRSIKDFFCTGPKKVKVNPSQEDTQSESAPVVQFSDPGPGPSTLPDEDEDNNFCDSEIETSDESSEDDYPNFQISPSIIEISHTVTTAPPGPADISQNLEEGPTQINLRQYPATQQGGRARTFQNRPMQHAGLQYGQGAANSHQSPPFAHATDIPQTGGGNTTSSLRQFRKKEGNEKQTGSELGENSQIAPTVRVPPHNHFPARPNDFYGYHPYQDFNTTPFKDAPPTGAPVKYSEIAETPQLPLQHVNHLPPATAAALQKHQKEKEFMEMCTLSQQPTSLKGQGGYDSLGCQQNYPPDPSALASHQYIHKDSQVHGGYKQPESQYQQYNPQLPKYGSVPMGTVGAQCRKYPPPPSHHANAPPPPPENDFLAKLQRLHPTMARSIMSDHHVREVTQQQQQQPTLPPPPPSHVPYPPHHHNPHHSPSQYPPNSAQRYYNNTAPPHSYYNPPPHPPAFNYPSCNYRNQQMGGGSVGVGGGTIGGGVAGNIGGAIGGGVGIGGVGGGGRYPPERSLSPRGWQNYPAAPQKFSSGFPTRYEYAQHYQHRQMALSSHNEHYPQQYRAPTQFLPSHPPVSPDSAERNAASSSGLRHYLENWAEEENNQSDAGGNFPPKDRPPVLPPPDQEPVYEYVESVSITHLIPTENGQFIIKGEDLNANSVVRINIDKDSTTNGDPSERTVNLQIVEENSSNSNTSNKRDCLLAESEGLPQVLAKVTESSPKVGDCSKQLVDRPLSAQEGTDLIPHGDIVNNVGTVSSEPVIKDMPLIDLDGNVDLGNSHISESVPESDVPQITHILPQAVSDAIINSNSGTKSQAVASGINNCENRQKEVEEMRETTQQQEAAVKPEPKERKVELENCEKQKDSMMTDEHGSQDDCKPADTADDIGMQHAMSVGDESVIIDLAGALLQLQLTCIDGTKFVRVLSMSHDVIVQVGEAPFENIENTQDKSSQINIETSEIPNQGEDEKTGTGGDSEITGECEEQPRMSTEVIKVKEAASNAVVLEDVSETVVEVREAEPENQNTGNTNTGQILTHETNDCSGTEVSIENCSNPLEEESFEVSEVVIGGDRDDEVDTSSAETEPPLVCTGDNVEDIRRRTDQIVADMLKHVAQGVTKPNDGLCKNTDAIDNIDVDSSSSCSFNDDDDNDNVVDDVESLNIESHRKLAVTLHKLDDEIYTRILTQNAEYLEREEDSEEERVKIRKEREATQGKIRTYGDRSRRGKGNIQDTDHCSTEASNTPEEIDESEAVPDMSENNTPSSSSPSRTVCCKDLPEKRGGRNNSESPLKKQKNYRGTGQFPLPYSSSKKKDKTGNETSTLKRDITEEEANTENRRVEDDARMKGRNKIKAISEKNSNEERPNKKSNFCNNAGEQDETVQEAKKTRKRRERSIIFDKDRAANTKSRSRSIPPKLEEIVELNNNRENTDEEVAEFPPLLINETLSEETNVGRAAVLADPSLLVAGQLSEIPFLPRDLQDSSSLEKGKCKETGKRSYKRNKGKKNEEEKSRRQRGSAQKNLKRKQGREDSAESGERKKIKNNSQVRVDPIRERNESEYERNEHSSSTVKMMQTKAAKKLYADVSFEESENIAHGTSAEETAVTAASDKTEALAPLLLVNEDTPNESEEDRRCAQLPPSVISAGKKFVEMRGGHLLVKASREALGRTEFLRLPSGDASSKCERRKERAGYIKAGSHANTSKFHEVKLRQGEENSEEREERNSENSVTIMLNQGDDNLKSIKGKASERKSNQNKGRAEKVREERRRQRVDNGRPRLQVDSEGPKQVSDNLKENQEGCAESRKKHSEETQKEFEVVMRNEKPKQIEHRESKPKRNEIESNEGEEIRHCEDAIVILDYREASSEGFQDNQKPHLEAHSDVSEEMSKLSRVAVNEVITSQALEKTKQRNENVKMTQDDNFRIHRNPSDGPEDTPMQIEKETPKGMSKQVDKNCKTRLKSIKEKLKQDGDIRTNRTPKEVAENDENNCEQRLRQIEKDAIAETSKSSELDPNAKLEHSKYRIEQCEAVLEQMEDTVENTPLDAKENTQQCKELCIQGQKVMPKTEGIAKELLQKTEKEDDERLKKGIQNREAKIQLVEWRPKLVRKEKDDIRNKIKIEEAANNEENNESLEQDEVRLNQHNFDVGPHQTDETLREVPTADIIGSSQQSQDIIKDEPFQNEESCENSSGEILTPGQTETMGRRSTRGEEMQEEFSKKVEGNDEDRLRQSKEFRHKRVSQSEEILDKASRNQIGDFEFIKVENRFRTGSRETTTVTVTLKSEGEELEALLAAQDEADENVIVNEAVLPKKEVVSESENIETVVSPNAELGEGKLDLINITKTKGGETVVNGKTMEGEEDRKVIKTISKVCKEIFHSEMDVILIEESDVVPESGFEVEVGNNEEESSEEICIEEHHPPKISLQSPVIEEEVVGVKENTASIQKQALSTEEVVAQGEDKIYSINNFSLGESKVTVEASAENPDERTELCSEILARREEATRTIPVLITGRIEGRSDKRSTEETRLPSSTKGFDAPIFLPHSIMHQRKETEPKSLKRTLSVDTRGHASDQRRVKRVTFDLDHDSPTNRRKLSWEEYSKRKRKDTITPHLSLAAKPSPTPVPPPAPIPHHPPAPIPHHPPAPIPHHPPAPIPHHPPAFTRLFPSTYPASSKSIPSTICPLERVEKTIEANIQGSHQESSHVPSKVVVKHADSTRPRLIDTSWEDDDDEEVSTSRSVSKYYSSDRILIPRTKVIDANEFDIEPVSSTQQMGGGSLQVYKDVVDSKLNSLSIQILKNKKPKVDDQESKPDINILLKKFLNKGGKLSASEIERIKRLIECRRRLYDKDKARDKDRESHHSKYTAPATTSTMPTQSCSTVQAYSAQGYSSVDRSQCHTSRAFYQGHNPNRRHSSYEVRDEDLKLHFRKIPDGTKPKKKRRFRNLYADSSEEKNEDENDAEPDSSPLTRSSASDIQLGESVADYSVYQRNAGVLIFKRKGLPQPFVKLERSQVAEMLVKKKRYL